METQKIKITVKQALPMISELIKFKFVTDMIGKSSGWLCTKQNSDKIITSSKGFNAKDIDILNKAFHEIGENLIISRIGTDVKEEEQIYTSGCTIPEQLKSLSKVVSMPYIYNDKLKKNRTWFVNRTSKPDKYKFKEEEIALINLAVMEIGNKLLSIELTLQ